MVPVVDAHPILPPKGAAPDLNGAILIGNRGLVFPIGIRHVGADVDLRYAQARRDIGQRGGVIFQIDGRILRCKGGDTLVCRDTAGFYQDAE